MVEKRKTWATLLTKPAYLPGVLVLNYSLRASGSKYPLVVMITDDLPFQAREVLRLASIESIRVDKLRVQSSAVREERFADTWTKLAAFQLVQFSRIVLLDSDMLIRKNMDELIEMPLKEGHIAAAHACACNPSKFPHYPADWVPENCAYSSYSYPPAFSPGSPRPYGLLNSGTVVLTPATSTYGALVQFLHDSPLVSRFLFPDQDLLAEVFRGRWQPLPYVYNALKTLRVVHATLWRDEDVKCVHYIFKDKPWSRRPRDGGGRGLGEYEELSRWWWDAYKKLWDELREELREETTDQDDWAWKYIADHVGN